MIDFVRVHYRDKSRFEEYTVNEGNFKELDVVLENHTGEIKYPYKAKEENMELVIAEKSGYVKGSLHKYFNIVNSSVNHNYNDFTYSNLVDTLDLLSAIIIDFESTDVTQLEVGFNLNVDKSPSLILIDNFLFHDTKTYNIDNNFNGRGKLLQFDYSQYSLKIYNKSLQYNQHNFILRFEVKLIKKVLIKKLKVLNLNNLRDKEILKNLFSHLLYRFDEMVIIDNYLDVIMDSKDQLLFSKFTNPRYWTVDIKTKSRATKSNDVKKFKDLIIKYDLNNLKRDLRIQLIAKFLTFINN